MKSQRKFLFALMAILLLFMLAATPGKASAAVFCNAAQFVSDVTVPDGTVYAPGETFTKTWRLKNVGSCTWTTDYDLVYYSGTQMGAPAAVAFPKSVAPGETVDLTVNMTAPSSAGHYFGYWKLRNASGVIFGIGWWANGYFWVEINVVQPTSVALDFVVTADQAKWKSGAGDLTFPGTDGDAKGFAKKVDKPRRESGLENPQPGLVVAPQNVNNGYIDAEYPAFKVQSGDRFQSMVHCEYQATSCYVRFRLDYRIGDGPVKTFWTFREKYEGWYYNANLDLSSLAGQDVKFILHVDTYGYPTGDRAVWGGTRIVRAGSNGPTVTPSPTATGPTPTPTNTPTPTATPVPGACTNKVQFIKDTTIPDGTIMSPGDTFTKTWRLKNSGTCKWTTSYKLVFVSGDKMDGPDSATLSQELSPGQIADVSIPLKAPSANGTYRGYWMMADADGKKFGLGANADIPFWVEIKVLYATTGASTYSVILIESNDVLNIRSGAGVSNPIVSSFAYDAIDVKSTGGSKVVGSSIWFEVERPDSGKGWVNSHYLNGYKSSTDFCADTNVTALLQNFRSAVINKDGSLLSSLISPERGVTINYTSYDKAINFTAAQSKWLFTSSTSYDWGVGPGGGPNQVGTFSQIIQPKLLDVLTHSGYEKFCETPKAGSIVWDAVWGDGYKNLRYYSLYRPGTPDTDLDWRTWTVGVDYVGGKPYIMVLMQFQWEP